MRELRINHLRDAPRPPAGHPPRVLPGDNRGAGTLNGTGNDGFSTALGAYGWRGARSGAAFRAPLATAPAGHRTGRILSMRGLDLDTATGWHPHPRAPGREKQEILVFKPSVRCTRARVGGKADKIFSLNFGPLHPRARGRETFQIRTFYGIKPCNPRPGHRLATSTAGFLCSLRVVTAD